MSTILNLPATDEVELLRLEEFLEDENNYNQMVCINNLFIAN